VLEDTKAVIIIGKSKKDRKDNGQKKKDKMTQNLLHRKLIIVLIFVLICTQVGIFYID
jgi:hypothetical protein